MEAGLQKVSEHPKPSSIEKDQPVILCLGNAGEKWKKGR